MGDAGRIRVADLPACGTMDVHGADDNAVVAHREEEARDG
jgi:hypothetical protein